HRESQPRRGLQRPPRAQGLGRDRDAVEPASCRHPQPVTMKIITRAQWGARPPRSVHRIALPTPRLLVHHSADDRQGTAAVRAHQAFHMDSRGWSDIAYAFLIDANGNINEGRGPGVAGGHTAGDNTK